MRVLIVVNLGVEERNRLIDTLSQEEFSSDPDVLKLILTRADLKIFISKLRLDKAPETVIFKVITTLERAGKDENGYERLGRFLSALTAGNYVSDEEEKKFITSLVTKYGMMQWPTSVPPTTPESKLSVEGEKNFLQEAIIGEDTLRPISFLLHAIDVSRCVCYVGLPTGSGTGFLIGKRFLLTNNHVIKNSEDLGRCVFRFNYQLGINGTPEQYEDIRAAPHGSFYTNQDLDYTVVQLENISGINWGYVQFATEAPQVNGRVNIIQHAGGAPKSISIQNNFVEYVDDRLAQYVTSTLPGSSGSPVFNNNWEVVALHHSGGMIVDPATNRKHYRNEGIRISAIAKDLPAEIMNQLSS